MLHEFQPCYEDPMGIVLFLCIFDSKTLLGNMLITVFGEERNTVIYIRKIEKEK